MKPKSTVATRPLDAFQLKKLAAAVKPPPKEFKGMIHYTCSRCGQGSFFNPRTYVPNYAPDPEMLEGLKRFIVCAKCSPKTTNTNQHSEATQQDFETW